MASCLGEIHFWTLRNQLVTQDSNIGCFTYHDKTEVPSLEHPYIREHAAYTESRDVTWVPKNKKPDKVRDGLKELEDLLSSCPCVSVQWLTHRIVQMMLSNGTLVSCVVSSHTGDVDRIFIDKSLVGKLSGEQPSDVLVADNYLAVTYPDKQKLDFIFLMKKPEILKKFEKINNYEPRISQVELPGPTGRRLMRRVGCNIHQDTVLVWWPTASSEAWPWSPMAGERDQANLVIYAVNGPKLDLIAFARTDCDPIGVGYSTINSHQILSVEQSNAAGGGVNANICVYECSRSKIRKYSTITVPMKNNVVCYGRNCTEDRVLLGCDNCTLVMYDENKKITHTTVANVKPNKICWHPSGSMVMVTSSRGEIQVFDIALAPLKFQLVSEDPKPNPILDLSTYFRSTPVLHSMIWNPGTDQTELMLSECCDSLFILYERGPMCVLQFYLGVMNQGYVSPLSLINEYIKFRQIDEAVNVLSSLSWNLEGQTCYAGLCAIANCLLRETLTPEREGQLEATLGCFYSPVKPHSEVTVLEYRDSVSRIARRFFHHLLRFSRFEKAYLLAVDIGARDLFMDIHFIAKDKGETALAEVCRRKAEQIDADTFANDHVAGFDDEEVSEDSEVSDADTYSSEEEYNETMPPRPPGRQLVIPTIGKAPPPPPPAAFANPPLDARFIPQHRGPISTSSPQRSHLVDMSELALQSLEEELTSPQGDEYTDALMDDPILPPPPSHADENQDTREEEGTSTVKVIHFGIV